jgi:hypothetical protein
MFKYHPLQEMVHLDLPAGAGGKLPPLFEADPGHAEDIAVAS